MRRRDEFDLTNLAHLACALAELSGRPLVLVHRIEPPAGEELVGAELERARAVRLRARAHYRLHPDVDGEEA